MSRSLPFVISLRFLLPAAALIVLAVLFVHNAPPAFGSPEDAGVSPPGVFMETPGASDLFEDVPAGAGYESAVSWMIRHRVASGCAPTRFCPEENLTRQQFVTFLWRAAGRPTPQFSGSRAFVDVTEGVYSDQAIGWAVSNRIILGCTPGGFGDPQWRFCPTDPVTRGQMAALLYRHVEADYEGQPSRYTDVQPDDYFSDAVAWLTDFQVVPGCHTTRFCPEQNASRAEAALFIYGVAIRPHTWGEDNTNLPAAEPPPRDNLPPSDDPPPDRDDGQLRRGGSGPEVGPPPRENPPPGDDPPPDRGGGQQSGNRSSQPRDPELVANFGQERRWNDWSTNNYVLTQGFTTGNAATTVESIVVPVREPELHAGHIATIRAELWSSAAGGEPASKLIQLRVPDRVVKGPVAFAAPPNTTLSANTTYHFVLYTTGRVDLRVVGTYSTAEDTGNRDGWSISDVSYYISAQTPESGAWMKDAAEGVIVIRINGRDPDNR